MVELIEKYKNNNEEVLTQVNHKLLVRFGVSEPTSIEDLKALVRMLFADTGTLIRNRVDVSEEVLVGSEKVHGEVIVAVRVDREVSGISTLLSEAVSNRELSDFIDVRGVQFFDITQLREISKAFNRALYKVVINLGEKGTEGLAKVRGDFRKSVKRFDGTIEEIATDGDIYISGTVVDGAEGVFELLVDLPHGVDVIRVIEKHFKLRKGTFENYPVEIVHVYEEVNPKLKSMTRKHCEITGGVIERTVGGVIGETSIKGIMSIKKAT